LYLLSVGYGEGSQLNEDWIVQFASKSSVLLIVHQTNAQLLEVWVAIGRVEAVMSFELVLLVFGLN
jgi:hypothetical protein